MRQTLNQRQCRWVQKCRWLVLIIAIALPGPVSAHSKGKIPKAFRGSVNPPEQFVREMYEGKSWIWSDGAGYYSRDGKFIAWYGSDKKAGYAVGRWEVYRWGNMCMYARWYSPRGSRSKKTCFRHRVNGDTILQKRHPRGKWYVFKGEELKRTDEINKLIDEDVVTETFDHVRTKYTGHRKKK